MTKKSTATAHSRFVTQKAKACSAPAEALAVEIIQGNFTSDADLEEFSQAIKMHGITFLYLANSPLPCPSPHDLNTIDRLARLLSRFWPQSLVIGGCHE